MREVLRKLDWVRRVLEAHGLGGMRLRGTDWFSWATCGGSNAVLLTTDVGVAEVWITQTGAWVLTDAIEAARLAEEEVPAELVLWAGPWAEPLKRESFIAESRGSGPIASDRPTGAEVGLPAALTEVRGHLTPEEVERYRLLGADAARAMTEVLSAARPEWTGFQLAGAGSEALWARGIHPALTLVGDEQRLPVYRHATAAKKKLGTRAMLVFCGRRQGLFANLTRFVYFRALSAKEKQLNAAVADVEARAFELSKPAATLGEVYAGMVERYRKLGHPEAERLHHQGGTCGYLSRDEVAKPGSRTRLQASQAVAWNPSLPGAKIEDTVVVSESGIEVLTVDPSWPTVRVDGRLRPDVAAR